MRKFKRILIVLLLFLFITIFINTSFAAPEAHSPNEYNISIKNILKKDVEKIEIFTTWDSDNSDKPEVEIDGRLFNYNNHYYYGIEGEEYDGIKCRIIDTINNRKIKEIDNGINFSISNVDRSFHLRIHTKTGKILFSDSISSYMIIDEFSYKDKEYVKQVKEFEKETVYFSGEYFPDEIWIEMENVEATAIEELNLNNNKIIIIMAILILLIFFILFKFKNKIANFKITIIVLLFILIAAIGLFCFYKNWSNKNINKNNTNTLGKNTTQINETEKFEIKKVNLINKYEYNEKKWKNDTVNMMIKIIQINEYDIETKSYINKTRNLILFSTEFFENFFEESFYDEENQKFYFYGKDKNIYAKGNDKYYYKNHRKFEFDQYRDITTEVVDGKLYIPIPLKILEFYFNPLLGFDEENNNIYYYAPEKHAILDESNTKIDNVKLKDKISEAVFVNDEVYKNDFTLEYMIDRENGQYAYFSSEINEESYIIKVYYKYNGSEYTYDRYEIITEEIDGNIVRKFDEKGKFHIIEKNGKYGIIDVNNNIILDCVYDKIEEGEIKEELKYFDRTLKLDFFKIYKGDEIFLIISTENENFKKLNENYYISKKGYKDIEISTAWNEDSQEYIITDKETGKEILRGETGQKIVTVY